METFLNWDADDDLDNAFFDWDKALDLSGRNTWWATMDAILALPTTTNPSVPLEELT